MSSSPPLPLTNEPVPDTSARPLRRAAVVLGANLHQPLAWWMDPARAIIFVVLPVFCAAAYFNRFNYWTFNASRDFVTSRTFGLGMYSMAMLILGIEVGKLLIRRQDQVTLIDGERATVVLVRMGWITIVAYTLLLGTLVAHIDIVLDLLRGDASAPNRLRDVLGQVPGVTSFVQFGTVYLALVSTLFTMTNFRMTPRLWTLTGFIFFLVFLRTILASERLALMEALAALFVIPLAYRWKHSFLRTIAPYFGIVLVFLSFASFEYFRSWQYYRQFYDSYEDFIFPRFAGYFSTSINNGSGAYLMYGQYAHYPEITVGWVTQFPVLGNLIKQPDVKMLDNFLETYASPEFNNPGGLYSAFLDYNFYVATLFMIFVGGVIGMAYRSFQNRSLVGMLLYPAIFVGTTDLIRVLYVTGTRTLPLFLGAFVAAWAVRSIQVPRDRFLQMASGKAA